MRPCRSPGGWGGSTSEVGLYDALVAAVYRHLGAGHFGEKRAAHGDGERGHVGAAYFGAQDVADAIFRRADAVGGGTLGDDFFGPQAGVEDRVRMKHVDPDLVS